MRIAIVGAGVSGLTAAHLLHREHQVTVFEAGAYAGGHTNTIRVETEHATHHVDTGFIVMNDRNYPYFTKLLDSLAVARQPTHMSFSVKGEEEDFEYCGTPLGIFCQPSNLISPRFQRMLADLVRFNRSLRALLAQAEPSEESLGAFLARGRFSRAFVERLIVPQVSAVWSADPRQIDSFPVRFLAEFFSNHGMLGFRDRPQWETVRGGSARYVDALTAPFRERIRLSTPVRSITRSAEHVELTVDGAEPERYDQVVIATHSDQALALLGDAGERERELLGAIPYQRNEAVLHTDSSLLPRRRARARRVELPPAARAQAAQHGDLLHEPPAAPARRPRLLRDAQPHRGDRPGEDHPHDRLLPPRLHRPPASRRRRAREISGLHTARTTAAPTGAGAFTRTACAARCARASRSGCGCEQLPVRGRRAPPPPGS